MSTKKEEIQQRINEYETDEPFNKIFKLLDELNDRLEILEKPK